MIRGLILLPLLIAGQGGRSASTASQPLGKRLTEVRAMLEKGQHRALSLKYGATSKMDAFTACAGDMAVRRWYLAFRCGLEPDAPGQQLEDKLKVALENLISSGTREPAVFLNLYWHEATFESFREDQPSRIYQTPSLGKDGKPIIGPDGKTVMITIHEFKGPDQGKVKHMQDLFQKAKKLAPTDKEVLYIEALHEKDPAKKYELVLRSYESGGAASFGPGFLEKLADSAAVAGEEAEARRWRARLEEKLKTEPNSWDTKLYLAKRKPGGGQSALNAFSDRTRAFTTSARPSRDRARVLRSVPAL